MSATATAINCANWKDGRCQICGVQWQFHEVSADFLCPHFAPREAMVEPVSNELAAAREAELRETLVAFHGHKSVSADLCQCPRCGRSHRKLGTPPGLKPRGVSRMADNSRAVLLTFDRELTDGELRQLHDNYVLLGGGFDT